MKKLLLVIITLSIITFNGCYDPDTATVIIDLRSNELFKGDAGISIIDKIVNILTLSNIANAAPSANFSSINVTAYNNEARILSGDFPIDASSIKINIPSGKKIKITVTAKPLDTSAVITCSGSVTVDLKAGETKNVSIRMLTSETKLVIPDYLRSRVVQIDDMTGANWKTLTASNIQSGISTPGSITPYDITFDGQGRIYVVNYTASTSYTGIFRIDSIPASGTIPATEIISGKDVTSIQWIAIDMTNSILYFATSTVLYRAGLDGTGIVPCATMPYTIYGIDVDGDGNVYISYSNGGGYNYVSKYNPSNFTTPAATFDFTAHYGANTYNPKDVDYKSGNVYVTISGYAAANQMIVQLDSNLQFIGSYGTGTATEGDTAAGHFYGPYHFVAKLNRRLYIIDDGASGGAFCYYGDKLVSIDDIDGTNWETYGSRGSGTGQFGFYYGC